MSAESAPPKKRRFVSRLFPRSYAGQVACATAIVLVLALIAVWVARWLHPSGVASAHAFGPWQVVIEICLATIMIPCLVYWVVHPEDRVAESPYPDIDRAWQLGLDALKGVGFSLEELPLMLVLGSTDSSYERALMRASLLDFKVEGEPHGPKVHFAMHWYVTNEAIYLFCTDTCASSEVVRQWIRGPRQSHGVAVDVPPVPYRSGIETPEDEPQPTIAPASDRQYNTVSFQEDSIIPSAAAIARDDSFQQPAAARRAPSEASVYANDPESHPVVGPRSGGTITGIGDASPASRERGGQTGPDSSTPGTRPLGRTDFAEVDTSVPSQRLQYLCHLIRESRSPHCGINGIVALLPFEMSFARERTLVNLAESIGRDVERIHDTLRLRAPITAIVTGLDRERGFGEFVLRLDPSFRFRRLGGQFNLRSEPTPSQLNEHSDRLCDAFEDWIYQLFREPNALANQRANRKLYGFLNRIRHELKPNLRLVVGRAFGCEERQPSQSTEEASSAFFSGCYFASLGGHGGPPAFMRDVLGQKLIREQANVQWDETALRKKSLRRTLGLGGWILLALLSVTLVGQLLARWVFN